MPTARVPFELLKDLDLASQQRLGLGQAAVVPQQVRQIVEAGGDADVLRTVARLMDGEDASIERLRFGQAVGGVQQPPQVVENGGDAEVVWAVACLADG